MGWFERFRDKPWEPTSAQRQAAVALPGEHEGKFVRTYPDGTAEVRTRQGGELRRYLIERDGTASLVEATWVRDPAWGERISGGGMLMAVVTFVVAAFVTAASEGPLPWWTFALAAVGWGGGLVLFIGGMGLVPTACPPKGELWKNICGADY